LSLVAVEEVVLILNTLHQAVEVLEDLEHQRKKFQLVQQLQ
jgi:hypothetical protein